MLLASIVCLQHSLLLKEKQKICYRLCLLYLLNFDSFFSFRKSQTSFIMNQNEVRGTPNFQSVSKRRKIMSFHQNFQSNRRWIEMSRILSFSVVVIGLMPMCLALSENIVCGSDIQTYVCLHKNYSR
jgi:hypothetical protein